MWLLFGHNNYIVCKDIIWLKIIWCCVVYWLILSIKEFFGLTKQILDQTILKFVLIDIWYCDNCLEELKGCGYSICGW